MTKDETAILVRLTQKVDEMAKDMVTKDQFADHCRYTQDASDKETARLNAIHDADAKALNVANAEANEKAATLAANVDKVSTTSRDLVEATRIAYSKAQADLINPIIEKIGLIEKKQYEDQGKQSLSEPMMARFIERMESVASSMTESKVKQSYTDPAIADLISVVTKQTTSSATNTGKGIGKAEMWGYIVAGVVLLSAITALIQKFVGN